ncbi:MAG: restriction endonuclease [Microbacterium sp. 14-71-5]|jgi:hypothetical protein|nr:MAG: restriction endonuclease [Microbacterium sp. 14-71-5]
MSGLNVEWAVAELDKFTALSTRTSGSIRGTSSYAGTTSEILAQAQVVEKILDQVVSNWRHTASPSMSDRWKATRETAIRARAVLVREQELRANLGDDAPEISAARLHPWAWSGASSLWASGHYREAVGGAARKLNAETQNKVGRRDLSETKLFQEAFTDKAAEPGKARLRRITPDSSDTYKSVQRGAMALAEGIFAGIRNPLSHEADQELDEQVALEYLAALSVLARWVDESTVEHAGGTA